MDIGRRDQFYQHQIQAGVERGSTIGVHGYFGGKFKLGKSCVAAIKWLECKHLIIKGECSPVFHIDDASPSVSIFPFFVSLATWWWRTNFDVMIYCSNGTGLSPVTHNKSKVRVSQLSCSKSGNINCSVCFCFIGKCHRTSHWVFVYFDLAALFVPVDCLPSRRPPRPPDTSLPVCAGQSPPRAPAGFSCSWPALVGLGTDWPGPGAALSGSSLAQWLRSRVLRPRPRHQH